MQAILVREISRIDSLPAADLMRLARLALEAGSPYVDQFRDAALAKAPDDPEINLAAYNLAIQRGLEYQGLQAHAWFQKAVAQSGPDGPIRTMSMREVVDQVPGWNRHRENVDQMLRRADAPLFIAARAVRRQFLDLTLGQALRNTNPNDLRLKHPVFAFSGAQPVRDVTGASSIALDITSIVTLDYLGLLESAITQSPRTVIEPRTLSLLFLERQFIRFHQPSEIAKAERLQGLIIGGRLKVVAPEMVPISARAKEIGLALVTLLAAAKRDGGVVVRSAPVFKLGSFPEERADMSAESPVLTDTLGILSFLSASGKIDSEVRERAEPYLRQVDAGWETPAAITPQSSLYLDDLSVNYLDHVGLLQTLTRSVAAVFVHADLDSQTRGLLLYEKYTEELLTAIERIRAIISRHVEAGRIQFSGRYAQDAIEGGVEEKEEGLELSPTLDLLSDLSGIDVVVVDDRCLNKTSRWTDNSGGSAPATSSLGILSALKRNGVLDTQSWWRARHKLRAAGYYAVPLENDELLHYLDRAPITDGKLRETPEVKAVRESVSLAQINGIFVAEEVWFNSWRYVVYTIIRSVWSKTQALDKAEAQAEWLLSILPDPLEWCRDPENASAWALARQQTAVQVGMSMVFVNDSRERRDRYFGWLQRGMIEPLQANHPDLWDAALGFFKSYALQLFEVGDEDRRKR